MSDQAGNSELLTPQEAATFLKLSNNTLRRWRWLGIGPKYLKVGGRVRYRLTDLNAFLNATATQTQTVIRHG